MDILALINMRLTVFHHLVCATLFFTIILIGGILFLSHSAVQLNLEETGKKAATYTADKILRIIALEGDSLRNTAYDWGVWDDTYRFVEDLNEPYIKSNLAFPSLLGLQVNDLLFFDTQGVLRYGVSADLTTGHKRNVSPELVQYVSDHYLYLASPEGNSGIISLHSGPVLIATYPILQSNEQGQAKGMVLIGRDLDPGWFSRISEYLLYPFSLEPIGYPLSGQYESVLQQVPFARFDEDASTITTLSQVSDILGKPAYLARMEIPYHSPYTPEVMGQMSMLVVILTALFLIAILALYRYFFARHMRNLTAMLDSAEQSSLSHDIIPVSLPPEFIKLAESAERVATSLRRQQDDLCRSQSVIEEAEERWQIIFEESPDPMCVGDDESFINVNRAWVTLFGVDRGTIVSLSFQDLTLSPLPDGTQPLEVFFRSYFLVSEDGFSRFEWRVSRSDGSVITYDVTIKLIRYRGDLLRFVAARDITIQAHLQDLQAIAIARIDTNLVQLGTLNDQIRNPLTIISGLADEGICEHRDAIQQQVENIDQIIDQLDKGFLDSQKVRRHLERYNKPGRW